MAAGASQSRYDQECSRDWPTKCFFRSWPPGWRSRSFLLVLFVVFITIKYSPIVSRHFQQQPPFMPLRVSPADGGEIGRLHDR